MAKPRVSWRTAAGLVALAVAAALVASSHWNTVRTRMFRLAAQSLGLDVLHSPFICSGHGIAAAPTGDCVCDLGWLGSECDVSDGPGGPSKPPDGLMDSARRFLASLGTQLADGWWFPGEYPADAGYSPAIAEPESVRRRVLFVTDTVGPLGAGRDAEGFGPMLEELVLQISAYDPGSNGTDSPSAHVHEKAQFQATLLYTGDESGAVAVYRERLREATRDQVQLETLRRSGLDVGGGSEAVATAYAVYHWLRAETGRFDTVVFRASTGHGFFAMQARAQGLFDAALATRFVAVGDRLSASVRAKVREGRASFVPTDAETLKTDHMHAQSLALADTAAFASRHLFDVARQSGWALPPETRVAPFVGRRTPVAAGKAGGRTREIVIVAPRLDVTNGLAVAADALDALRTLVDGATWRRLRVTFIGGDDGGAAGPDGMDAESFLQMRQLEWGALVWQLAPEAQMRQAVAYASEKGAGRLAVAPSSADAVGFLLQELVQSGAVVVAADVPANRAVVHPADRPRALFSSRDASALAALLCAAIVNGTSPVRPGADATSVLETTWVPLLASGRDFGQVHLGADLANSTFEETPKPLVTVVLTHRNRHELAQQAIASLEKQTYPRLEVVLVDDGSDAPETLRWLNELTWTWWETRGWRVVRSAQQYLGAARNLGVQHARGEFVVFMDDDDVAKPHQVATLVRAAQATGAVVVTAGHDTFVGSLAPRAGSALSRYVPLGGARRAGMVENVFGDAAMLVQRTFFVQVGGFSQERGVGFEDYEFLARVVLGGHALAAVPEALHWYRLQRDGMSRTTDLKANQARFLRPYFEQAQRRALDRDEAAVLAATKRRFFARDMPLPEFAMENANENATIPVPAPVACALPELVYSSLCGACFPIEPQLDCAGKCPNDAAYGSVLDCAGVCVAPGGSPTAVVDGCGVCGGDSSSCTDCAGVLHGSATADACGVCNGDGSQCLALAALYPTALPNTGSSVLVLIGAGFATQGLAVFVNHVAVPLADTVALNSSALQVRLSRVYDLGDAGFVHVPVQVRGTGAAAATGELTLTIYRPDAGVAALGPDPLYVRNGTQTVLVIGQNYAVSPLGAFCAFGFETYGNASLAPLTVVNATLATCPAPYVAVAQQVSVNLFLGNVNSSAWYLPTVTALPLVAIYYEPSPEPVRVLVSDDVGAIDIRFDKATTGAGAAPCVDVFDTMSDDPHVALLYANSLDECTAEWQTPRDLRVTTTQAFRRALPALFPQPGLFLKFKPHTIATLGAAFSDATLGKVLLGAPLSPQAPVVAAAVPAAVGPCAAAALVDLSRSWALTSAPLLDAEFTYNDDNIADYPHSLSYGLDVALVDAAQAALENGTLQFAIPADALWPDHHYRLHFRLTTIVGLSSTTSVAVVRSLAAGGFSLAVSAPALVSPSEPVRITALIDGWCDFNESFTFAWTALGGALDLSRYTNATVELPAGTLAANSTVTVQVQATAVLANVSAVVSAQIRTDSGAFALRISGASRSPVSVQLGATLEAEWVPDDEAGVGNWTWYCQTSAGGGCVKSNGQLLPLTSAATLVVPPNSLGAGTFVFWVTATALQRNVTAAAPPVAIVLVAGDAGSALALDSLRLPTASGSDLGCQDDTAGFNASLAAVDAPIAFASVEVCTPFEYAVTALGVPQSPAGSSVFIVQPGVFSPGRRYCVQAAVPGTSATAAMSVAVASVPSGGTCFFATPFVPNVLAWSTALTIQCTGYTVGRGSPAESARLQYAATLFPQTPDGAPDTARGTPLQPATDASAFTFVLGPGDYWIRVDVLAGSVATPASAAGEPVLLNVTVAENPDASAGDYWANVTRAFAATGNAPAAVQAAAIVAPFLRPDAITSASLFRRLLRRSTTTGTAWDTLQASVVTVLAAAAQQLVLDPQRTGAALVQTAARAVDEALASSQQTALAVAVSTFLGIVAPALAETAAADGCLDPNRLADLVQLVGTQIDIAGSAAVARRAAQHVADAATCALARQLCGQSASAIRSASGSSALALTAAVVDRVFAASHGATIADRLAVDAESLRSSSQLGNTQCVAVSIADVASNYWLVGTDNSSSSFQYIAAPLTSIELAAYSRANVAPVAASPTDVTFAFALPLGTDLLSRLTTNPSWEKLLTCAFFDPDANAFSSVGCSALDFNGTHLACSCSHLTDFVVAVGTAPLPSTNPTSSSAAGMVIGLVVGLLAAALAVIVAIAVYRRHQKRKTRLRRVDVGTHARAVLDPSLQVLPSLQALPSLHPLPVSASAAPKRPLHPQGAVMGRLEADPDTAALPAAEKRRLHRLAHLVFEQELLESSPTADVSGAAPPPFGDIADAERFIEDDVSHLHAVLLRQEVGEEDVATGAVRSVVGPSAFSGPSTFSNSVSQESLEIPADSVQSEPVPALDSDGPTAAAHSALGPVMSATGDSDDVSRLVSSDE